MSVELELWMALLRLVWLGACFYAGLAFGWLLYTRVRPRFKAWIWSTLRRIIR